MPLPKLFDFNTNLNTVTPPTDKEEQKIHKLKQQLFCRALLFCNRVKLLAKKNCRQKNSLELLGLKCEKFEALNEAKAYKIIEKTAQNR